jgi:hypothetical protein
MIPSSTELDLVLLAKLHHGLALPLELLLLAGILGWFLSRRQLGLLLIGLV